MASDGIFVLNPEFAAQREQQVALDAFLVRHLRPHQRDGIRFMYSAIVQNRGCILADTMGLGKTLQALGLLWATVNGSPVLKGPPLVRKAVIVCPSSLCGNWRAEVRKWLGDRRIKPVSITGAKREQVEAALRSFRDYSSHKMLIISYEQLRSHSDLINDACDLLICDEGHRLRTQGTATYSQLDRLRCRRRILLSGTPLQNDLEDFFYCGKFVRPDLFPDAAQFHRLIAQPLALWREPTATEEMRAEGACAARMLEEQTSQFVLRRTNEVLQDALPPRLELVLRLRMMPQQVKAYRTILGELQVKAAPREVARALQAMLALRLLCNDAGDLLHTAKKASRREDQCVDPRHQGRCVDSSSGSENENQTSPAAARGTTADFWEACTRGAAEAARVGASVKASVLFSLLRRVQQVAPNDRVVVVSNFRRTLVRLQAALRAANFQTSLLCGRTPNAQRMDLVDAFNAPHPGGFHILLLSSKAGGVGLNLIGANRLVLYDPDWNPANDAQAMARIWREGQKKQVFIYRLILGGTLEEKICQRQHMKEDLAAVTVDHMAGGAPRLSWEEMRRVFELEGYSSVGTPTHAAVTSSAFAGAESMDQAQAKGALLDSKESLKAVLSVHVINSHGFAKDEGRIEDEQFTELQAVTSKTPPWAPTIAPPERLSSGEHHGQGSCTAVDWCCHPATSGLAGKEKGLPGFQSELRDHAISSPAYPALPTSSNSLSTPRLESMKRRSENVTASTSSVSSVLQCFSRPGCEPPASCRDNCLPQPRGGRNCSGYTCTFPASVHVQPSPVRNRVAATSGSVSSLGSNEAAGIGTMGFDCLEGPPSKRSCCEPCPSRDGFLWGRYCP